MKYSSVFFLDYFFIFSYTTNIFLYMYIFINIHIYMYNILVAYIQAYILSSEIFPPHLPLSRDNNASSLCHDDIKICARPTSPFSLSLSTPSSFHFTFLLPSTTHFLFLCFLHSVNTRLQPRYILRVVSSRYTNQHSMNHIRLDNTHLRYINIIYKYMYI